MKPIFITEEEAQECYQKLIQEGKEPRLMIFRENLQNSQSMSNQSKLVKKRQNDVIGKINKILEQIEFIIQENQNRIFPNILEQNKLINKIINFYSTYKVKLVGKYFYKLQYLINKYPDLINLQHLWKQYLESINTKTLLLNNKEEDAETTRRVLEIERVIIKGIQILEEMEQLYLDMDLIKLKVKIKKEKEWLKKWKLYDKRIKLYEETVMEEIL